MLKKLTDEKLSEILAAGVAVFAQEGPDRASVGAIAKRAGISVGVLYKYFGSKDDFFLACLHKSLGALEAVLSEVRAADGMLLTYARRLIEAVRLHAQDHGDELRMYLQITCQTGPHAARLAEEIEGTSARLYTDFIGKAQACGDVRRDLDAGLLAFFFDNLLMLLQFSYGCDYYKARMGLYSEGGTDRAAEQLLRFLESAFTVEQTEIVHWESP